MSEKNDISDWKFHDEFQGFKSALVDFFVEIGKVKWHSDKLCIIAAYIFLYEELTQKQLKELTGYALSTISANINVLLACELKKRRIVRTNKFEYYFGETLQEYLQEASEARNNEVLELYAFLSNKLVELKDLNEKGEMGAEFIHERATQLFRFAEIFKGLIESAQSIIPRKDKNGGNKR